MGTAAKPTRENRTITVDFHDESTYFQLLCDGKAFVEFVSVSHLLHMAFCGAMRFTIPAVIRAPCDVESTPPAEAA